MANRIIYRAALGSEASLGDMYDIIRDEFCGASVFTIPVPENTKMVKATDSVNTKILLPDNSYDLCGKFSEFDINAEQQLSILTGLATSVTGSGLYLINDSKSARAVNGALIHSIRTKEESISIYNNALKDLFEIGAIESGIATHVVTGIFWGAMSVVSCSYQNDENREIKSVRDTLEEQLKNLSHTISSQSNATSSTPVNPSSIRFDFRVFGDILTVEDQPKDFQSARDFIQRLPAILERTNEKKGKPISYRLTPISQLQSHLKLSPQIGKTFQSLDEMLLARIFRLLEDQNYVTQRLHDLLHDSINYKCCLSESDGLKINALKKKSALEAKVFVGKLSKLIETVRAEQREMSELEDLLDTYESGDTSPKNLLKTLKSWTDILEKLDFARSIEQAGATYIGHGQYLDADSLKQSDTESVTLYFTKRAALDSSEIWNKNKQMFFNSIKKRHNQTFYAVDCDIHPALLPDDLPCSLQVIPTEGTAKKELKLQNANKSTNDKAPSLNINDCGQSSNTTESGSPLKATQKDHERHINPSPSEEYYLPTDEDFDHTNDPSPSGTAKEENIMHHSIFNSRNQLVEKINILILGETGVGKSTWINGFINFLQFGTLKEAEAGEPCNLIPSSFTVCNEDFEEIRVNTGTDNNEEFKIGQSATQEPQVYEFDVGDTSISLIDTPGIGDTRGIDQDKTNFESILNTLSNFHEVHGICILLKPNNARLNLMFRFCIKELLKHLHKDASKNIMFCFTNSRGTFYRPGDTMPALKELLKENKDVEIPVSRNTVYCYDSEAYRFLAAVKNNPPVSFPPEERQNFENSWKKSIAETNRMLTYIGGLKPHAIKSTLNLNHARHLVLKLARPLAEITRNIQTNKSIVEEEMSEILATRNNIEELKKKQMVKRTEIEVREIDYPKTVCGNSKCIRFWSISDNIKVTEYFTVCHEKCFLTGTKKDSLGDPNLMRCWAILENNNCRHKNCGHSYKEHLHVYYESVQVARDVEDKAVKESLQKNLTAAEMKQAMIDGRLKQVEEYESELKIIQGASAEFAYFLKQNAITPYNDELEKFLGHLIREEEDKVSLGASDKTLKNLRLSLDSYIQEKQILEQYMKAGRNQQNKEALAPNRIEDLVRKLKQLKHGKSLDEALKYADKAGKSMFETSTIHASAKTKQSYPRRFINTLKGLVPF